MKNNLRPFVPHETSFTILPLTRVHLEPGFEEKLGFKVNSNQYKFLKNPAANKYIIIVFPTGVYTNSPTSPHVVSLAFGTVSVGTLELTHVSVNKDHPYNRSDGGKNWGAHGIVKDVSGRQDRWRSDDSSATKLTMKNHTRYVHGTPNPYAAFAIYKFATSSKFGTITTVKQNPAMPCAKLFHKDYHHTTHPAIQLLYESLGFVKPIEHYQWDSTSRAPLSSAYNRLLEQMRAGLRVV